MTQAKYIRDVTIACSSSKLPITYINVVDVNIELFLLPPKVFECTEISSDQNPPSFGFSLSIGCDDQADDWSLVSRFF